MMRGMCSRSIARRVEDPRNWDISPPSIARDATFACPTAYSKKNSPNHARMTKRRIAYRKWLLFLSTTNAYDTRVSHPPMACPDCKKRLRKKGNADACSGGLKRAAAHTPVIPRLVGSQKSSCRSPCSKATPSYLLAKCSANRCLFRRRSGPFCAMKTNPASCATPKLNCCDTSAQA